MEQFASFSIFNDSEAEIEIIHEPECFEYVLPIKQEVIVATKAVWESVQLKVSIRNGKISIAIFDDKSYYRVLHNGKDAFGKYMED